MLRRGSEAVKRLNVGQTRPADKKSNNHVHSGNAHNELQKFKDADKGQAHHKPKKAKAHGASHPSYRVTIVFLQSDKRRRDLDGQLSTVLDCLRNAVRRFSAMDTGDKDHITERKERL